MPRHRIARGIAVIIVHGRRLWWLAPPAGGGRAGGQAAARWTARRESHCWPLLPRRAAHDIIPASVAAAVLAVSENRVVSQQLGGTHDATGVGRGRRGDHS